MSLFDCLEPSEPGAACAAGARVAILILPGWDEPDHKHYDTLKERVGEGGALVRVMRFPRKPEERDALSCAQSLERVLSVYDCMRAQMAGPACVAVIGVSFGAYLATLLSARRPVAAMALRSPALYPDAHFEQPKASLDHEALRRFRQSPPATGENLALEACRRFSGDVFLVACERDEVIPAELVEAYAHSFGHAASMERHQLACADHELSEHDWRVRFADLLCRWLRDWEARRETAP